MELAIVLAAILALLAALWAVSLGLRDASIVDIFWGPGFAVVATLAYVRAEDPGARGTLLLTLASLWGLRLGLYLFWRNAGKGEDARYQRMRRHHGDRFWLVSLFTVFGFQGLMMWTVSLPLQVAQFWPGAASLGWLDAIGVLVFTSGLVFESVGDWQLARFKADPENSGRVMDRGLWRYTRHPNYFGDFLVWWGIFVVAVSTPYGFLTIVGPLLMSFLLMRVSGVPMLERSLRRSRPGYEDYAARTSAFFPRPPGSPGSTA